MIGRVLAALSATLLLGTVLFASGNSPAIAYTPAMDAGCSLRVAWEPYDPFTFRDNHGTLTGVDIELIKAIAEEIGCDLSFRRIPWNRILLEIETGAADVSLSTSWTKERDRWAWFSAPYRRPQAALFVRKDEARNKGLGSLADVPRLGFRLGVIEGYFLGEDVARHMADPAFAALVEGAADYAVNLNKLLHGRIGGFLADDVDVLRAEAQALSVLDAVERHPLQVERSEPSLHVQSRIGEAGRRRSVRPGAGATQGGRATGPEFPAVSRTRRQMTRWRPDLRLPSDRKRIGS